MGDERAWAEGNFKEIRASIERDSTDRRTEAVATRRWLIGLVVTVALGVVGIVAKFMYGV